MKTLSNQRGSILLICAIIMYLLIALAANFAAANVNEINYARRFYHSTAAFWLAEAGVNMYMKDPALLTKEANTSFAYGGGTINLTLDDSKPLLRLVTATGTYGHVQRTIQISYPARIPQVYENSLSTKGDFRINGGKVSVVLNGQVRVSGTIDGSSRNASVFFEDVAEHVDSSLTSLSYNEEGSDSLNTFIKRNQEVLSRYPSEQVLHVRGANNYELTSQATWGKKIVYVEGGEGTKVTINSNDLVRSGQTMTVITTGNVTFNQSGRQPPNSQLNIIAWGGYSETVRTDSVHRGVIYTHGTATFDGIKDSSETNGHVIADGGIVFGDIWSTKIFNYKNMMAGGVYPPGFEALSGGSTLGIALKPNSWKEVTH